MSKFIMKIGNFMTETLLMENITDENQIKQIIKSTLEEIIYMLLIQLICFFMHIAGMSEIINFDFEVFGITLMLLTLFRVIKTVYYINKL